jgi:hypothetical protein
MSQETLNDLHIPLNVYLAEYRSRASLSTAMAADCCVFEHSLWPFNAVHPSGYYMHYQIYHSEILHSARTVYLRVVSMDLSKNKDCLYRMNWLDFVTDTQSVYCAVRTEVLT